MNSKINCRGYRPILKIFVFILLILPAYEIKAAPGDPDYSFGFLGVKYDSDPIYRLEPRAVAQQPDGKLLVAGAYRTESYNVSRVLLRRYMSSGAVDYSFGLSGYAVAQIYPSEVSIYGAAYDLLVQADGKIVVAGYDASNHAAVWRFTSYGELDTTFGTEGKVTLSSVISYAKKVTLSQGKILVGVYKPADFSTFLRRLNANGTSDTTFGFLGSRTITIVATDLALIVHPRSGSIIVAGTTANSPYTPALQHLNSNGAFDTAYGASGISAVPLSVNCGSYTMTTRSFVSLAAEANGKLVAGGMVDSIGGCTSPSCYGNAIVRLNTDDSLDTTYGSNGYAAKCNGRVNGPRIKLAADGSIQLLAYLSPPITNTFDTTRFRRYGSSGFVNLLIETDVPVADFLAQQADGKIVIVQSDGNGIRLARYLP